LFMSTAIMGKGRAIEQANSDLVGFVLKVMR